MSAVGTFSRVYSPLTGLKSRGEGVQILFSQISLPRVVSHYLSLLYYFFEIFFCSIGLKPTVYVSKTLIGALNNSRKITLDHKHPLVYEAGLDHETSLIRSVLF